MKKIILGLFLTVGFTAFASAKNTLEGINLETSTIDKALLDTGEPLRLCGVAVTFYDSDGHAQNTVYHTIDAQTYEACAVYQAVTIWVYQQAGFNVVREW